MSEISSSGSDQRTDVTCVNEFYMGFKQQFSQYFELLKTNNRMKSKFGTLNEHNIGMML